MIAKIKKLIKFIIQSILSLLIILHGVFKIFINFNRIISSKYIILQSGGGFAHTLNIPDFIRSMKNRDEYLYILFFDISRYNFYTQYLHNINQINIYTSFLFKKIKFGEYEKSQEEGNYAINFLTFLISKLKKKKTKIYIESAKVREFWDFLLHKNKKIIEKFFKKYYVKNNLLSLKKFIKDKQINYDLSRTIMIHLLCKNNKKYQLPESLNKKIMNKVPISRDDKILTIYIRSRVTVKNKMNKDYFLNDAKNCNSKDYAAVVKYFLNLNWKVILIGDEYLTLVSKIKKNVNLIFAEKFSVNKQLLEIFSMLNSDLVISTFGGAQFLSFYTHTIYTNIFPLGFIPGHMETDKIISKRNEYVLSKNIYFKKKKISGEKFAFKTTKPPKDFTIRDNTEQQILNFCKKHYNKYVN